MEKEIAEMKRTLNGLSEKFDRYLKGFPSSKEYQEYRKDLEKLGQLKRELQELKRTLNQLRGYRY
jgi:cell shape-determining protein MreC